MTKSHLILASKDTMNPVLPKDLAEKYNVHIPFEKKCWNQQSHGRKRLAVINNFSAAGGNTTLSLEESPKRHDLIGEDHRKSHVVTISAKSRSSLRGNITSLISYLESNQAVSLTNLSYTTCKSDTLKPPF
jgi:acyl transferase domain-containing protein